MFRVSASRISHDADVSEPARARPRSWMHAGIATAIAMIVGALLLVPASSSATMYCRRLVSPHSSCTDVGVYDFLQANANDSYYSGTPAIDVCQKVRNWADTITVSRRCDSRAAYSYADVVTWVMCSGGNPSNIRYYAGNDSSVTHTIWGTAYTVNVTCT